MSCTLAVTGSNLCGNAPYSVALVTPDGTHVRSLQQRERGDPAVLSRDLCREAAVELDAITDVIVDVGPGSYTGLRVVVTFVRVLMQFADVKVRAVDSLAMLAHRSLSADPSSSQPSRDVVLSSVRVLLDARRGRYHVGHFRWQDGALQELAPAAAERTESALAAIESGDTVIMPTGLFGVLRESLEGRGAHCRAVHAVDALDLLRHGLLATPAEIADLEPRYLMASYAED
ncbi:MAG: tRNA (adenosine(37)-N6)-threonylcarbamoyltransferase complex dimerization subunit type 1 TsaB [Planctomycetota bacterium]